MGDPFDKATALPPATLGEGCLSRYDLAQLAADAGTSFPGAEQLWQSLHPQSAQAAAAAEDDEETAE